MRIRGRRKKSVAFFITLGVCLVVIAVALNVGWILLNWRQVALLVFGIIFFTVIIAGLVLNTTFLVREIRRNEQHDAFINAVTHELKTPIASIRLYLETLQTRDVEEAKRREFYQIMLADSDRLLHTVEQVLRAGQSGQKQQHTHEADLDLADIVRPCLERARTRYPHLTPDALRFVDHYANGDRPVVRADAEEMRAVVSNLIDNAVKYSPDAVRVRVEVAPRMGDHKRPVELRVSDKGIGIPPGQLKRVFKRFYRAPGRLVARIKGTGLGLFIVDSLVRKHGGRVFAESAGEGQGSTFTIRLPRAAGR